MHDGSHWALAARNADANAIPARIWCSFMLWSNDLWTTHHSLFHHAFTGHPELDPDLRHAKPFISKLFGPVANQGYWRINPSLVPSWAILILWIIPGQALGQAIA